MKIHDRRGTTLIELLVALTIFSLLSVAVLFSLRTGIRTLERTRERVAASRRSEGAERALERMLAGIMSVRAEFMSENSSQPASAFFFQGDPGTMRFVTTYSLEEGLRGTPHIVEFGAIRRGDGAGLRLVVNESGYFGPASAGAHIAGQAPSEDGQTVLLFRPFMVGPKAFVLADRLPACQFLYLDRVQPPEVDRWVPVWRKTVFPRAIRIVMGPSRAVTGEVHVSYLQYPY